VFATVGSASEGRRAERSARYALGAYISRARVLRAERPLDCPR